MAPPTHFANLLQPILINPHTFDANTRAVEGPLENIAETSQSSWNVVDPETIRGDRVRCWDDLLSAAYFSELA
jgi:hypothetical protein